MISWAWDAGSYSGWQVNVGLAHSVDTEIAAPIPIQVGSGLLSVFEVGTEIIGSGRLAQSVRREEQYFFFC